MAKSLMIVDDSATMRKIVMVMIFMDIEKSSEPDQQIQGDNILPG